MGTQGPGPKGSGPLGLAAAVCPGIGGLPSLTSVTHQSEGDKNRSNLRGVQGEPVEVMTKSTQCPAHSAPSRMSAILRACPGPGGSRAEPHFIKQEDYVERIKFMYTNEASE